MSRSNRAAADAFLAPRILPVLSLDVPPECPRHSRRIRGRRAEPPAANGHIFVIQLRDGEPIRSAGRLVQHLLHATWSGSECSTTWSAWKPGAPMEHVFPTVDPVGTMRLLISGGRR